MRTILALAVGLVILAAVPGEAAPISVKAGRVELGAAPPLELVAGGCGPGFHRRRWRDGVGRWHWGRCVPN